MREARLIGTNLKLAFANLDAVNKITPSHHTAPTFMFYAAENLLMALLTSEKIDIVAARQKHGNHQLHRIIDEIPDCCTIKPKFKSVVDLVVYATTYRYPTSTGNLPRPPSEADSENYFEALLEIFNSCHEHFMVDVRLEQPEAGSVSPFR